MEIVKAMTEIFIKWNENDAKRKTNIATKIIMDNPKIFEHLWNIRHVKDDKEEESGELSKLDKIMDIIYRN